MKITHSPILYQGGGTALLARSQLPDKHNAVRQTGAHPRKQASNVPLEHGLEGELLKARAQTHTQGIDRHLHGDTLHGESWPAGNASAQRAISMYRFHAQAHLHPTRHVIDTYA